MYVPNRYFWDREAKRVFSHLTDPPIWVGREKEYALFEMHTPHIWNCIEILQTRVLPGIDRTAWIQLFNQELERRLARPVILPEQTRLLKIKFRVGQWLRSHKRP